MTATVRSTYTIAEVARAESAAPPFPLTCEWCRSAPASHLLILDRFRGSRTAHSICHRCAHRDVGRAREIAASPTSVWLFELHPDACPDHKPEGTGR
jgi:hypothetical protein